MWILKPVDLIIYPAIEIIEKANVLGDIATLKKEAVQLGYLCCVQLNSPQKQEIFQHQLSEIELALPTLEQTAKEVNTDTCFVAMRTYIYP